MHRMRCSLGPEDSFWASCNGTQRWVCIPKHADEALQAGRDPSWSDAPTRTKIVSLGCGHTYYIAFEDCSSSWEVESYYPSLEKIFTVEKRKAERIVVAPLIHIAMRMSG